MRALNFYEIRQAVLNLSNKDFDHFEDWFEDLCDERWAEEVKNDPMAQEANGTWNETIERIFNDVFAA